MPIDANAPRNNDTRSRLKLIQGGKKPSNSEAPPSEYARFERGILESFEPVGFNEHHLATSIAHCMWRQQQVRNIENRIYAAGLPDAASEQQAAEANLKTFMTHSRYFADMSLYEDRVDTLQSSYMRALLRAQRERRANQARARKDACAILRKGIAEGNSPDPQREVEQNGFVFSIGELLTDITREHILRSARASARRTRQPKAS